MQKVALALLLVAVTSASALTFNVREKRSSGSGSSGSGSSPLSGAVGSISGNSGSSGSGTSGSGSGGLVGAGAGASGVNEQTCKAMQGTCAAAACTSNNNQVNEASGDGLLAGVGQLVGNVGAPVNACPAICVTCLQAGLLTLG